jgi:hypothetical protein
MVERVSPMGTCHPDLPLLLHSTRFFMNSFRLLLLFATLCPAAISACDLCALYSASHAQIPNEPGWTAGLATQFTHFSTMRIEGDRTENPAGQYLDSTITQLFLQRRFTDRLGLQFNVPYLNRTFRRPENDRIVQGSERGLGDMAMLGQLEILRRDGANTTFIWSALAGVKLPTGRSRRIAEEQTEGMDPGSALPSGIHGHDLTIGSGSTDALVGTQVFIRRGRFFTAGQVQYATRQRGDYDYRFANDLSWELAPGAFVLIGHVHTLSAQLVASGERKGNDTVGSKQTDDTGMTSVYAGPKIAYTYMANLSAMLGVDFPLSLANTGLQLTPDYRIRTSMTYNF